MEINRQNYEMFLIEYIDGNLPDRMVPAMLLFLKNNPDIDNEIKSLQEYVFTPELIKFESKSALKKNHLRDIPGISDFEQLSIAFLEKDISTSEGNELNKILELSPEKKVEHQLIQLTRLKPDLSQVYPKKNKLKHNRLALSRNKNMIYYAVAAGIILFIGFSLLLRHDQESIKGSPFSFISQKIKPRPVLITQETLTNIPYREKSVIIIPVPVDTFTIVGNEKLELISPKLMTQIDPNSENLIGSINEMTILAQNSQKYNANGYTPIQTYINYKFKEKVLKQDKNEKISLISVINAFGRFTHKFLNKKLEVEKTLTEDGNLLYAIKTDSYDFYTIRGTNNKKKANEDNGTIQGKNPKKSAN